MRAALIDELGRPPRLGEAAPTERGDRQALVQITAAPINPVDLSIAARRRGRGPTAAPACPIVARRDPLDRRGSRRGLAPAWRKALAR